jgi:hypothetical protein
MKAGWQIRKLGDICSFENGDRGTNYPSRSFQTKEGIPFINAGHLTDGGITIENLNFIPRDHFNLLSQGKIRSGDILFCLRGSLGKFAGVGSLSEGAIASSLVIVRPKERVSDKFVLAYFSSDLCADMINRFKSGTAQPNLSAKSLSKFKIPIPPSPNNYASSVSSTKRLTASTPPRLTPKRTSKTPAPCLKAIFNPCSRIAVIIPLCKLAKSQKCLMDHMQRRKRLMLDLIFLGISALQDGKINLGETRHVTLEDFRQ